jgi:glycosyltransferase involved in cell wall biosynthesis
MWSEKPDGFFTLWMKKGDFGLNQFIQLHPQKTIICLSSTHWHFLWQRPQQIMSKLSQDYQILFVDPPYAVTETENFLRKKHDPQNIKRLNSISQSLKVLSPYQIAASDSLVKSAQIRENNLSLIREQICQALNYLCWNSPALLWVYHPQAVNLVGHLGERGVIYDCVDSFASFSWSDPQTSQWEAELVRKADLVLTSAGKLYQQWQKSGKPVYLIPNAADYEHFSKCGNYGTFEPSDLKAIKHPRLGFIGALYEWLDFELLQWLATQNPHWNLVMIGPRQHGLEVPEACRNIHWLGPRDYKTLPWYLNCIEVMLIPFLRNQTTEHANPIKFWEYLAAGKPVVATLLPEISLINGVTWVSENYRQFNNNCHSALNLVSDPSRQKELVMQARLVAKDNSWEGRCRQIIAILKEHFK